MLSAGASAGRLHPTPNGTDQRGRSAKRRFAGADFRGCVKEMETDEAGRGAELATPTSSRPSPAAPPLKPLAQWSEAEVAADAAPDGSAQPRCRPDAGSRQHRCHGATQGGRSARSHGSDVGDAVPQLVQLLDDPDAAVRKAAARTLGRNYPPRTRSPGA